MKQILALCFVVLVGLGVASAVQRLMVPTVPAYDPVAAAQADADIARLRRENQRAEELYTVDLLVTAAWRILPALALAGGLAYLSALGVAHATFRFRHAAPDHRGLLNVPISQLPLLGGQALGAYHATQQLAASHAPVPHTLTYSPHQSSRTDTNGMVGDAALVAPAVASLPDLTDMAGIGHVPTVESILLGLGLNGERITVPARALCHVALVGATGGGKSNLMRLLLAQVLAVGAHVVLVNPHHATIDAETGEDWGAIERRLQMAPAVKAAAMEAALRVVVGELDSRMERRFKGEKVGGPLFLAIDELPSVAKAVPTVMDDLGRILREGRKVGVLVIGASQSMLVKSLGGDATLRDAYRTAYYLGGDLHSGAALLDMPQRDIDDGQLTTGLALLRSVATTPAQLVRVPLASNAAIDALLGSPAASTARRVGFHIPPDAPVGKPNGSLMEATPAQASTASQRPEVARVRALFAQGLDIAQIVKETHGIDAGKGGRTYQDAAKQVQALLREALEVPCER